MHGKYPFPEATATTQVLISGEGKGAEGGSQAKTLVIASLIGGIYDYLLATFGWWAENVTSIASQWGATLAEKTKLVFSVNTGAALLGLGYIIGIRYAFIICAGSFFVWWVLIPLIGTYGAPEITSLAPGAIFSDYARLIGIGGIAMAGVLGIIKSWGIIVQAVGLAGRELKGKSSAAKRSTLADRYLHEGDCIHDCSSSRSRAAVLLVRSHPLLLAGPCGMGGSRRNRVSVYDSGSQRHRYCRQQPRIGHDPDDPHHSIGNIRGSRPQRHIGHRGINGNRRRCLHRPVDGRRLCHRPENRLLARLHTPQTGMLEVPRHTRFRSHCRRCDTCLEQGVRLLQPRHHRSSTGQCHGSRHRASHDGRRHPWILYMAGAVLALILNWLGVPALAFCLGMFIPLQLNTPLLVGGAIAWWVGSRSKDEAVNAARRDRGTLISSGLIAGGALFGVFAALTRFCGFEYTNPLSGSTTQTLGIVLYALLIIYLLWDCMRAKKA